MHKATTDDIAAIAARQDAMMVVLIHLLSRSKSEYSPVGKYTKMYDDLVEKFRKDMVSKK